MNHIDISINLSLSLSVYIYIYIYIHAHTHTLDMPWSGESFMEEWTKQGEAMDEVSLQRTLEEWLL